MIWVANQLTTDTPARRIALLHIAMTGRTLRSPRKAVTIVEVLFAMFVVLFGLVGLVVLLPLASRQAGDSFMMTQGGAMMQNTASDVLGTKAYAPTRERGWWFADDHPSLTAIDYDLAYSMGDLYQYLQTNIRSSNNPPRRNLPVPPAPLTDQRQIQWLTRESFAYGFCIDPLFCADQFSTGWRYGAALYTPQRKSPSQILFRRTRMPFFDEHAFIDGNFVTGAVDFVDVLMMPPAFNTVTAPAPGLFPSNLVEFPRLMRVSFPSGIFAGGQPLPLPTVMAEKVVAALGDLVQADATDDPSYGGLRGFQASGAGFLGSPNNVNITWMITLTPSEQTPTGILPTQFNLSLVVMNRRDRSFDAAPLGITGAETYPKDEKIAYATSTSPNNAVTPFWSSASSVSIADLPGSTGGTLELKLWGAALTDPTIREGDWVMLSRKLSLGDVATANYNPKLIHRHRWYRVIGVDARESWPRVIRVAGDAWDYPEYVPPVPPIPVALRQHGFLDTNPTHLRSVLTTVTICPSVEMVYKKVVSLE